MDIRAKSKIGRLAAAASTAMLFVGSALAHHGFASYMDEEHTVTGKVLDMYFGFPHPHLLVEVDGEPWDVWLAAFGRVRYSCFHEALSEGDAITATGHRVPDMNRLEMKAKTVLLGEELYDFYPPWNPLGGNANPKRTEPCPT